MPSLQGQLGNLLGLNLLESGLRTMSLDGPSLFGWLFWADNQLEIASPLMQVVFSGPIVWKLITTWNS